MDKKLKANENDFSIYKSCFAFSTFVSLVLLILAGICDIVYSDFTTCEQFLTAFSICAALAFSFWIANQGDRLYYPEDRFLGIRLPVVEYIFGFGLVCFLCAYLFAQIHVYKESAQNPYLVLSNDVIELSSFSPVKIRCRIRLSSRELQENQDQIFTAFSDLIVPIQASIHPRVLPWDDKYTIFLNATEVEVKKVSSQIQQTFSIDILFDDYDTVSDRTKWGSSLCNADDCGFQFHMVMYFQMLETFVSRYGISDIGNVVISMRISDPGHLEVPWALKADTQYNPLPLRYKVDKWTRRVNLIGESTMSSSMVKVDPDAFSCKAEYCVDLLIPTYEHPQIDVETQTEERSFDFNSICTALIAMVSACVGIFSFIFKNVLPKRFFIWGSKSFREPQELFQSDMVELMSTIEQDQTPHPEIELQDTLDDDATLICDRECLSTTTQPKL